MIWPRIADFLRKQFKQHREVGKTTGAGKPLATGSAPAVKINKLSSQSSSFASSAKTGKTKPAGRSADGNYLRVYVPDPVSSKPSPRNRTAKAKPSNADFNTDTSSLGEIDRWQGHGKPAGGKKKGEKVSRTPILDSWGVSLDVDEIREIIANNLSRLELRLRCNRGFSRASDLYC